MENNINIIETVIQAINMLFNTLFSSIDNNAYSVLDDITFIKKDILYDDYISELLGTSTTNGIIIIASALIFGVSIYYCIRYLTSGFTMTQVEKPFQYIFKLVLVSVGIYFSFFIIEQFININSLVTNSIRAVGEYILKTNISFEQLVKKINLDLTFNGSLNIFSFDGIIKSMSSIGLFGLLFTYALRYIMVKVFILATPLVLVSLLNNTTSWIFKAWFKSVLSLLVIQVFIALILLVVFTINFTENGIFTKLMYIGSIYALNKANSFVREMFGGIATDISGGISGIKNIIGR